MKDKFIAYEYIGDGSYTMGNDISCLGIEWYVEEPSKRRNLAAGYSASLDDIYNPTALIIKGNGVPSVGNELIIGFI